MNHRAARWLGVGLLAAAGFLSVGGRVSAQESPELKKVFADWQNRQNRIQKVRYRVEGEQVIFKGGYFDLPAGVIDPPRDITCKQNIVLLLDFTTNRFRLESNYQSYIRKTKQLESHSTTTVYDGQAKTTAIPREANGFFTPTKYSPEISVARGNMRGATVFTSEYWPFFVGHGVVGTLAGHIIPGRLRRIPDPDEIVIHGRGVHAGRTCLILRTDALQGLTTTIDEIWVDPARESAVVRQLVYAAGRAVLDLDIRYQQTPHGWLPERWTCLRVHPTGQPFRIERMRVVELTVDPPVEDADFKVEIRPGMVVSETTYGGSPENILGPPVSSQTTYEASIFHRPDRSAWWWVPWACLLAVLALGAAAILWRRRMRRARPAM